MIACLPELLDGERLREVRAAFDDLHLWAKVDTSGGMLAVDELVYGDLFCRVPDSITQDQADAMFMQNVEQRAEKWVRLYVTADVTQAQFDALCSIAYNMSPKGFKQFANAVNAGQGIDGIANASVSWVASNLQNGIANRRATEVALFDNGVYA